METGSGRPAWSPYAGYLLVALLCAAAIGWSWERRFLLDDTFISLRYADHLVRGDGLVWNPGERVEGYTNFLWTLLLALPLRWQFDPELFIYLVGMALLTVALLTAHGLFRDVFPMPWPALAALFLLGTNYSFTAFATGGLETILFTTLFLLLLRQCGRRLAALPGRCGSWATVSLLATLLLLTRPDGAVLLAAPVLTLVLRLLRRFGPARGTVARLAALAAPAAVILGVYASWKWSYYGALLPNTFQVKVAPGAALDSGGRYLHSFLFSYWLYPALLTGLLVAGRSRPPRDPFLAVIAGTVALWCGYVAAVGGDFMEFRMLVPVLPLILLLAVKAAVAFSAHPGPRLLLLAVLVVGNLHHTWLFERTAKPRDTETVGQLAGHLWESTHNWRGIGQRLGAAFAPVRERVTIATTAAGAIPYYSGLRTVDMLGLNDAWVARHGVPAGAKPGHRRCAPLWYLTERGVNLVIGAPWMENRSASRTDYALTELARRPFIIMAGPAELPADAAMLEIPMPGDQQLVVLYLVPHPAIDAVIASQGWRRLPIRRDR